MDGLVSNHSPRQDRVRKQIAVSSEGAGDGQMRRATHLGVIAHVHDHFLVAVMADFAGNAAR
jgi:hypothetical protein